MVKMTDSKLDDWFDSEEEFEEMYELAVKNCWTEEEENFIDNLDHAIAQWGMEAFFSERQYEWLKQISER